ncbi:uncharacterized protein [Physcomitrium patens]|uniref:SET domain-containing protein n=1 Tax=Physcomitrium patens TaxID=3218 RepID=A0A7I4BTR5_PHYPA|nr:uncharacterized protein LOC112279348 [Physcomitrium patens]XP_024369493.1 uncharacterized protein LOC112279348 [Physcomitrium patens]XP_024369501.1 uncharacterized protein LOC112279348 [Physcomitrium patens]XP_024369510.1 uncharacterized protein LOC112279348 [Physcomitrium patens]|eukprot:XP_024369485.1 uncharacterized protein LOC112279348 [Physcomitrella patens]
MSDPPGHMEPIESPGKKASAGYYDRLDHAALGLPSVTSKFIGPGHAETVAASERFDKAGLLAAHLAALHDAYMLERGLLPGSSLPDSEAPPIPPVYAESPWKEFKLMSFAEMKIGKTHRKHALEGRLCAKSLKVTSVVNVLEEDSGLATKLILTNALPMRASMVQAQNCYPEGARVTVRDPYLTRFPDGVVGVLVERPHDIAFLSRPENTGERGTTIYGAVGLEGYDDGMYAQITSRDQEDFSRKIHLFEQQMKQEGAYSSGVPDSFERKAVLHSKPLHYDTKGSVPPSKDESTERSSPLNDRTKEPEAYESITERSTVEGSLPPATNHVVSQTDLSRGGVKESNECEEFQVALRNDDGATSYALTGSENSPCGKELPEEETFLDAAVADALCGDDKKFGEEVDKSGTTELVGSKDADTTSTGLSGSISKREAENLENGTYAEESATDVKTQLRIPEVSSERKIPLIRKQFQRSDSLLAVQEVEDCEAIGDNHKARGESNTVEAGESERFKELGREEQRKSCDVQERATQVNNDWVETHSANELRVLGNLLFGEENYEGAADLYTRSIRLAEAEEERQGKQVCKGEIILGYSNRAEAYIRLEEYGKALADALMALSRDSSHLKSLFRKGRALLRLRQYEQALTTLQVAAPRAPSDKDLQAALHESSTGVQQSCYGHYDLSHYYLKGKQAGESPFCADYIGPVIITDVGRGRGRGLVLTKDVEAGELLLVSNPIANLQLQVDHTRREISEAIVNGRVQEGFLKVLDAAQAHKNGLEKLLMLCDGEKALPAPPVNYTELDSATQKHLDAASFRRIIQLNAINGDATMGWKNLPCSGEQNRKVDHWGLWWLPSFMNHSCLPSSSPIRVGKALFVFASRDLRAGDEVTRAYFDIFLPLDQRKELSMKGWDFACHCPRCKLEDALDASLSKVTEQYTKLMELASKPKSELGTDDKLSEIQTSAAMKFLHKLETKLRDFKLNAAESNWVRCSFLHYIDMISVDHELHTHLEGIVEALVTVCPGNETTLHMTVVAKDSARRTFGKKSPQFKAANQRALNICRFTYGKQKVSILQSVVDRNDYQS